MREATRFNATKVSWRAQSASALFIAAVLGLLSLATTSGIQQSSRTSTPTHTAVRNRWIPTHLDVPRGKPATVVAVQASSDGHLHVTRTRVVGPDQANELASALAQDPATIAVSIDQPIQLSSTPVSTTDAYIPDEYAGRQWALSALDVAQAWQVSYGHGVTVAVIDTGVDATQPDLAGRLVPGVSYFAGQAADHDGMGHGTQVAGIIAANSPGLLGLPSDQPGEVSSTEGIAGIAPMAKIMPIKVFDDQGRGSSAAIAQGIIWAVDHGAQIINISCGANSIDPLWMAAISYAMAHQVTIVAAAGNDRSSGSPTAFPAAMDNVIAVAAVNEDLSYTVFSNAGGYIDVTAPGNMLWSTNVDKYWSTPPGDAPLPRYEQVAGTSFSSPYVAGALALVKSVRLDLSPQDLTDLVESTATDLGPAGRDDDYGYGLVNPVAMLCQVGHCPGVLPKPPIDPKSLKPIRINSLQIRPVWERVSYPGDQVILREEVLDTHGNPVVGALVTTAQVNAQFGESYIGYTNGDGVAWLKIYPKSTKQYSVMVDSTDETAASSTDVLVQVSPEPKTKLQLSCSRYGVKVTIPLSAGQTLTVDALRPGYIPKRTSWVLAHTGRAATRSILGKAGMSYRARLTWRGKTMAPVARCQAPRR